MSQLPGAPHPGCATPDAPILRDAWPTIRRVTPRESAVVAGLARADITAPVGVRAHNWGASRTEVATGVHRPLTATALAIADGERWRYLVSLDLGWWRDQESYERLAAPVRERLGATADELLLHLVHTHAGPSICDLGSDDLPDHHLPGAELLPAYHEALIEAVADCARRARETAVPGVVTWAYGHCGLAVARNLACGGRDVVAFEPGVAADDTLAVGRVSVDGSIVGVIVNYACHPTTLAYENSLLSPDYVGAMREVVERATGAPCLFLQGASGELSPREQYVVGPEVADRHGARLGHAALEVLAGMGAAATRLEFDGVVESGAPLGLWRERPAEPNPDAAFLSIAVDLEVKQMPAVDDAATRWPGIDPLAARERVRRAVRVGTGYVADKVARHPLWTWMLGDAVLVAHPGEAFSALQTSLRERHPERVVLVANLTGGPGFVYLPDRESYQRDRYQVWQTVLAPGCLETLIDVADGALASLPPARKDYS